VSGALQGDANTAVGLDGSSGQIQLPSLGTASNWTVEGWTDLNAGESQSPRGDNVLYASSGGVGLIVRPAGVYAVDLTTGPTKAVVKKPTASNVGSWVYWALVRNGPTLTVYRNATAIGSVTLDKPAVPSLLDGAIGASSGTSYLHGNADEVAVYTSALTPSTLLSHYHLAGYGLGLCGGRSAMVGGAHADRLAGTPEADVIVGGPGNDRILAGDGDDLVCAGPDADRVVGGPGNDRLLGEAGNDILFGGPGNDQINPRSGRDRVVAGPGNDRIVSRDSRRDVIDCGPGRDVAIVDAVDRMRRCETVNRVQALRRPERPAPRADLGYGDGAKVVV
jgi:Ca2+-binding RTX toxin-like protein